jgi:hypothetical protein
MEKTKPLHHIRYGSVEASIWENLTQGGGALDIIRNNDL